MDLYSPATIKYIRNKFNFKNAKSLGQNFLMDPEVILAMVDAAEVGPEDVVLEIGPGIGVLTDALAKRAGKVIAVEIDKALLPVLDFTLAGYDNIEIINQDILKIDIDEVIKAGWTSLHGDTPVKKENIKILGNLPYYITTPIITGLLEAGVQAASITIMMQKEVAERICANPGSKTFGALSVAVQYYCQVEEVAEVPKECFYPAPKVDSAVLNLKLREEPAVKVKDKEKFFQVVKAGFGQRRKTLLNSLSGGGFDKEQAKTALESAGIDGLRRAETLSLEEFALLADAME